MKKGQLMSQPFVYIFALILGGLILVWGFKAIMDLKTVADKGELGQFRKDLETEVNVIYQRSEGTTKPIRILLGKAVKYVCFSNPGTELKCKIKRKKKDEIEDCEGTLAGALKRMNDDKTSFYLRLKNQKPDDNKILWYLPLSSSEMNGLSLKHAKPVEGNPLCYENGGEIILETMTDYVGLR
ncbi:hypothetical protein D6777_01705 [Candidatus Woesearchaeota archaeon]|nr:MAG: hypothetical protein D6777_01705 [Candidatus Woesearchaeota archaeon]